MKIKLFNSSVAELFNQDKIYTIPPYQRNYAWDTSEISDFISDLSRCLDLRRDKQFKSHFFGSIVSIENEQSEKSYRFLYEIIDGQQRIATFSILAFVLYQAYGEIHKKISKKKDFPELLETAIKSQRKLKDTYLYYQGREGITHRDIRRVTLSKQDEGYFGLLLEDVNSAKPECESHKRIFKSYKALNKFIKDRLKETNNDVKCQIELLLDIEDVLEKDYQLIHIVTTTREDAYDLFQVLNDRGTNLTDGDLIKAKVLEEIDDSKIFHTKVNAFWDDILSDKTSDTKSYLRWIYSSHTGKTASRNLHKDFTNHFFKKDDIDDEKQDGFYLSQMEMIHDSVNFCRKLISGENYWPFPDDSKGNWYRNKLNQLVNFLENKAAVPLLMSAVNLGSDKFVEIITLLEVFFFRFKTICNGQAARITEVYNKHAIKIREEQNYDISLLKKDLQALLDKNANDEIFKKFLVEKLKYSTKGRSNKPIKFFLIYVDYYWDSYSAKDAILQTNGNHVLFSLTDCTLEHVYPQKASNACLNDQMEMIKHDVGNLVIFDTRENIQLGNDEYTTKKDKISNSSPKLNKYFDIIDSWDETEIEKRTGLLIELGLKVFRLN